MGALRSYTLFISILLLLVTTAAFTHKCTTATDPQSRTCHTEVTLNIGKWSVPNLN